MLVQVVSSSLVPRFVPSFSFNAVCLLFSIECNIEKLGKGLGERLSTVPSPIILMHSVCNIE